jgi:hypothetical protein
VRRPSPGETGAVAAPLLKLRLRIQPMNQLCVTMHEVYPQKKSTFSVIDVQSGFAIGERFAPVFRLEGGLFAS